MQFTPATPNDFAEYARLYYDFDADVLYRSDQEEINPQKEQEALKYFGLDDPDSDFFKQLEDDFQRTPEKFQKDLLASYNKIIMITDSGKTVGFVELYEIKRSAWKIGFLCLEENYQNMTCYQALFNYLVKKQKIRQLDVITLSKKTEKDFISLGFDSSFGTHFLRKKTAS